jgi:putative restriction endonuclease
VILSLAASLFVNHRRFGGSTAHLAPSPVRELGVVFKRPSSSILAKMANLDGSRSHGGRAEMEASSLLLASSAAGLLNAYAVVLEAARAEGITEAELPDFLGVETQRFELLGQEEISDYEVEAAVAADVAPLMEAAGLTEKVTERLLVGAARVGQHVFAGSVVSNCGGQCVMCGLAPGPTLERRGLIRASHIKPWRDSNNKERLDTANGLALCPDHDVGFDRGLLLVTDDLRVEATPLLAARILEEPRIRESFGQPPIRTKLLLPENAVAPGVGYLRWHREHIAVA